MDLEERKTGNLELKYQDSLRYKNGNELQKLQAG